MEICKAGFVAFGVGMCLTALIGCGGGSQSSAGNSAASTSISTSVSNSPSTATFLSFNGGQTPVLSYRGTNLSGGEFGDVSGIYGYNYIYPNQSEVDYFINKRMNVVRLPFLWERLQSSIGTALNETEMARIDAFVAQTAAKGVFVILDPHNYAYYRGQMIDSSNVPNSAFADFWGRLASRYLGNPHVIFGLMNEPIGPTAVQWAASANAAVAAIRASGATNLILVPGTWWTGAHSWIDSGNSVAMLAINDPINNFVFEVHQYLDSDSSGTQANCVSSTIGSERVQAFTNWLRANGRKGFLGEFAGANNDICKQAVDNLLTDMENNSDVWAGWTWWSAGPWWGNYMFSIEPLNGVDQPLMSVLANHL
ncbi:MAG TPA: glycoside hydrolase family 5 protein [Rhodocyclaceae bacterium]|nr:glycoside hydrolase family 5 protein [Rhodocyclaceae bacterium]